MEQIKLNPTTLQPDENGQPYKKITIGSSVILVADSPIPEPQPEPVGQGGDA